MVTPAGIMTELVSPIKLLVEESVSSGQLVFVA
jgi:hypothetical protein